MSSAPYPLALAAGVLAAVNPCGFALLPAYATMVLVDDAARRRRPLAALARAVALTGAMTLGFAAVFGAFGLLAAPAADWLAARVPWLTVGIGLVLAGLGCWLLAGRDLPSPVPKLARAPRLDRGLGSMALFGASFAVASLGCTIGPFLGVVVTSFDTGTVAEGAGLFLAYAAGMALVVGTVAVAVALARDSLLPRLRRAAHALHRLSGLILLTAGLYAAWFGWYEIRLRHDPATVDPIVARAGAVQSWLAATVHDLGPAAWLWGLAGLVALTAVAALRRR
ncbi:cytochrome c biogenesis protein CcdA [Allocatelliglobosispora scoriae]|uniref:Cytochrome c biogenesis protein CcdA n=1 Tax=Allocatelliglobosispora scoriae TaxID=643052 RepID=A0A841BF23_9ACTN|nr:cytochrome c biogenesis protein CcdA [Allocatelliglobosispora scoriae]MBB5867687.1 cytochrome c biogenesis protein CcdA [Allocatelliglobosispora scoriae]